MQNIAIATFFLWLLTGCTTTHYKSGKLFPVYVSIHKDHRLQVILEGKRDFYLWGLVPNKHEIELDQVLKKRRSISFANIKITEYQNFNNTLMSILSLGMYTPISYKIEALAFRRETE